jgi:hypothetical protein
MTTNHHTPIAKGAPASDETVNQPLSQLDERLTTLLQTLRPGHYIQLDGADIPQQDDLVFQGASVEVSNVGNDTQVRVDHDFSKRKGRFVGVDFFLTFSTSTPFSLSNYSAGSNAPIPGEINHPGIARISSHATNAPSGGGLLSNNPPQTAMRLSGGEELQVIFRCPTVADTVCKLCFANMRSIDETITNGVWISVDGDLVQGRTADNGSTSLTGTGYTISADQWYRAKIVLNSDATQVDFYLYDDNGDELWHDALTSNIPTAAGRECAMVVMAGKTSAGTAAILDVDWIGFHKK